MPPKSYTNRRLLMTCINFVLLGILSPLRPSPVICQNTYISFAAAFKQCMSTAMSPLYYHLGAQLPPRGIHRDETDGTLPYLTILRLKRKELHAKQILHHVGSM